MVIVGQSSYCHEILKFKNFSKNLVGIENAFDKLHFISWAQIQKISFL